MYSPMFPRDDNAQNNKNKRTVIVSLIVFSNAIILTIILAKILANNRRDVLMAELYHDFEAKDLKTTDVFYQSTDKTEDIVKLYHDFKVKYNKVYNKEENFRRFIIFYKNVRKINLHNNQQYRPYTMGLNQYSDTRWEEMNSGCVLGIPSKDEILKHTEHFNISSTLLEDVDWRNRGIITPVKNQMQCGSCYAFSATGSMESAIALSTGNKVMISEQQLIDCSGQYGNLGCNGGYVDRSFQYVMDNQGIDSEGSYSYEGTESVCRFQSGNVAGKISRFNYAAPGEDGLAAAVNERPVSVYIFVNENFMHYTGGIFDDESCHSQVNHAVLVVGYGSQNGQDYWIIKNSWGTSWGMEGYMYLARNKGELCEIGVFGVYPIV